MIGYSVPSLSAQVKRTLSSTLCLVVIDLCVEEKSNCVLVSQELQCLAGDMNRRSMWDEKEDYRKRLACQLSAIRFPGASLHLRVTRG